MRIISFSELVVSAPFVMGLGDVVRALRSAWPQDAGSVLQVMARPSSRKSDGISGGMVFVFTEHERNKPIDEVLVTANSAELGVIHCRIYLRREHRWTQEGKLVLGGLLLTEDELLCRDLIVDAEGHVLGDAVCHNRDDGTYENNTLLMM